MANDLHPVFQAICDVHNVSCREAGGSPPAPAGCASRQDLYPLLEELLGEIKKLRHDLAFQFEKTRKDLSL